MNGYREYDEAVVDRVMPIRRLLDAGLPTRIINQILPCLNEPRSTIFPTQQRGRPERLDYLRIPIGDIGVEQHTRTHPVPVETLDQPPNC